MSKHIDVVYGNQNNIELNNIPIFLEEKILEQKRIGKITYYFVSDDELLEINKSHLNHDYYTDIITFDYSTNRKLEGEIYVSIDRVRDNGKDFIVELIRVMSHGVLHMLGFKDKSEEDIKEMRRMENKWIDYIVSRES